MSNRCTITGFKILAKNLPPLKASLETTYQVDVLSCKRIITAAKKVYPQHYAEAEEVEWMNGVALPYKSPFY